MQHHPKHPKSERPSRPVHRGRVGRHRGTRAPRLSPQRGICAFAPGARTAWHSHAVGQTLYIAEGEGLVQARGEAVVALRAGEVVSAPAGELHWHGAAPDHFMTHLAVSEGDPTCGEHLTDTEYHSAGQ